MNTLTRRLRGLSVEAMRRVPPIHATVAMMPYSSSWALTALARGCLHSNAYAHMRLPIMRSAPSPSPFLHQCPWECAPKDTPEGVAGGQSPPWVLGHRAERTCARSRWDVDLGRIR